jgi:PhnB protein
MAENATATKPTDTAQRNAANAAKAPVRGGLTPYLRVDGAIRASEFYQRAFGAEIAASIPPDDKGRTMHVHLYINGQSLMLSDAYPEHGVPLQAHQGYTLMLPLAAGDIDRWWKRAVDAGCTVIMPLAEQFWGDRYGQLRDPFGVDWALDAPIK